MKKPANNQVILWGIPTIESTFDVANMVKTANVKDVPINNDALLKHTGLLNSCLGKWHLLPYLVVPDIGKSSGPRSVTDKNRGGPVKPCIEAVRLSGKKFPYMEKESPSVGNLERSQGGLPPNAAL